MGYDYCTDYTSNNKVSSCEIEYIDAVLEWTKTEVRGSEMAKEPLSQRQEEFLAGLWIVTGAVTGDCELVYPRGHSAEYSHHDHTHKQE